MSKVFVVQQHMRKDRVTNALSSHDYSTAEKFGQVIFLVPARQIVEAEYGGDVERLLMDKLKDFTTGDFLLPSGDAILCAQAVLAAASYLSDKDKLKMLKWDRHQDSYAPVEIGVPF